MTLKKPDTENLEDYAVDVGKLKSIHQRLVSKRGEIEALVAGEQGLEPPANMSSEAKQHLTTIVDRLLAEWQTERTKDGTGATGSVAFAKLAQAHFDLEQQILDAEDEQVEEATEHPFDHPLR